MQLQEDTLFANRYQLINLLGRGGFSEVWLAKDNWTHLKIALKVYAPGTGMDANGLQEFCGELAGVYDLNHQNLLKPQHVDTWENMPYLIMAYCSQGSCGSKLGKMSETEMWKFIHDVAAGLAYLHAKEVVHQDIKPDNILIDDAGNYLITDFGVSTRARSTLRKSVVASSSGGTTAYMGPERFSRQPAPTKASDIWSFGAMCFELLEGVVPFGEIGGGMQKGGAEIPAITADVSNALKYTITKMLQKETWDRPTAATLVEWSTNPNAIEVDYSLLEETEPVVTPSANFVDGDRSTQRLGTASSIGQATHRLDNVPAEDESVLLSVSPTTINVPAEGGVQVINIQSDDTDWRLGNYDEWIHFVNNNSNSFVLRFDKNKTGETRKCSFDVKVHDTNGKLVFTTVRVSQISLPKSNSSWWKWLLGTAMAIVLISCIVSIVGILTETPQEKKDSIAPVIVYDVDTTSIVSNVIPTELSVSDSQLLFDAGNATKTITVQSNNSWELQNTSSNIFSVSRSGNVLSISCNANTSTSSRNDYFDIITYNGAKSQRITIIQKGRTETQVRTSTKQFTIDSKISKTNSHLWKVLSIKLTPTKTILYERVTPRSQNTYVYCDGSEFIEDADSGKKYYLKYSDIGTPNNPKILYSDEPYEYTCTYPMIPENVRAINIYNGSQYIVKNFIIQ